MELRPPAPLLYQRESFAEVNVVAKGREITSPTPTFGSPRCCQRLSMMVAHLKRNAARWRRAFDFVLEHINVQSIHPVSSAIHSLVPNYPICDLRFPGRARITSEWNFLTGNGRLDYRQISKNRLLPRFPRLEMQTRRSQYSTSLTPCNVARTALQSRRGGSTSENLLNPQIGVTRHKTNDTLIQSKHCRVSTKVTVHRCFMDTSERR